MKVRIAQWTDALAIVELGLQHREEIDKLPELEFDQELAETAVNYAIGGNTDIILVATEKDVVIGYMWLTIQRPVWTQEHYASEQYLFIRKDRRNGRALLMLIAEARRMARWANCSHLQVGVTSGVGKAVATYEKRYEKVGAIFNIKL